MVGGAFAMRLGEKSARSGVRPWLKFCVCGVSLGFWAGVLNGCVVGDSLGCWLRFLLVLVLDLVLGETEALSLASSGSGGSVRVDVSSGIARPARCSKHFFFFKNLPTSRQCSWHCPTLFDATSYREEYLWEESE